MKNKSYIFSGPDPKSQNTPNPPVTSAILNVQSGKLNTHLCVAGNIQKDNHINHFKVNMRNYILVILQKKINCSKFES